MSEVSHESYEDEVRAFDESAFAQIDERTCVLKRWKGPSQVCVSVSAIEFGGSN